MEALSNKVHKAQVWHPAVVCQPTQRWQRSILTHTCLHYHRMSSSREQGGCCLWSPAGHRAQWQKAFLLAHMLRCCINMMLYAFSFLSQIHYFLNAAFISGCCAVLCLSLCVVKQSLTGADTPPTYSISLCCFWASLLTLVRKRVPN